MEPLADPENDRAIKEIIPPPHRPINDDLLYPNKCILNIFLIPLQLPMYQTGRHWKHTCIKKDEFQKSIAWKYSGIH